MHQIKNESSSDDDNLFVDTMTVNSIHGQTNWTQHAKIDHGKTITTKIDTGAMCNVMSYETYKSLGLSGKFGQKIN